MELPAAIGQSYSELNWIATRVLNRNPNTTPIWVDELLAEAASYQRSIELIGRASASVESTRLHCLLKSIDVEINTVLRTARAIAQERGTVEEISSSVHSRDLETHMTRLQIKGQYLMDHLSDFFTTDELQELGPEFSDERNTLVLRMLDMSAYY
jgi:hypothetical protein